MKPIQINDSLIAIQVPKEFDKFRIARSWADGSGLLEYYNIDDDNGFCTGWNHVSELEDDEENYQIIGLVQTPEIKFDFDVLDEWVESYEIDGVPTGFFSGKSTAKVYKNYVNPMIEFSGKNNSFRSRIEKAIQDSGLYLFNPYEKPYVRPNESNAMARILLRQYNEAESKTIKNNLLIIQKI